MPQKVGYAGVDEPRGLIARTDEDSSRDSQSRFCNGRTAAVVFGNGSRCGKARPRGHNSDNRQKFSIIAVSGPRRSR